MPAKCFHLLFLTSAFFCVSGLFGQYSQQDWDERDQWMNVPDLMRLLDIGEGDIVADVGCHEGYMSVHLSKKVGNTGKVYAVDIEAYRIKALKDYTKKHEIANIKAILGDFDDPNLPDNSLDAVVVMDTYHEMEAHTIILSKIKKSLKPGGKLLILEKLKEHKKGKSRKEQVAGHTLSSNYVKKELEEAGFRITDYINDFGTWNNESDKQMWILVAVPN